MSLKIKHFINLTNGIQAIQDYSLKDYSFIRIQSSHCESKKWDDILLLLSDDFLMSVALGKKCVVYDYSANKEVPRAVWQGLEWIKYVLYQRWYSVAYKPQGRASRGCAYFYQQYNKIDNKVKSKIDYFTKFTIGTINIEAITKPTDKDGNYSWYASLLKWA